MAQAQHGNRTMVLEYSSTREYIFTYRAYRYHGTRVPIDNDVSQSYCTCIYRYHDHDINTVSVITWITIIRGKGTPSTTCIDIGTG